jgi:hypothetical protein
MRSQYAARGFTVAARKQAGAPQTLRDHSGRSGSHGTRWLYTKTRSKLLEPPSRTHTVLSVAMQCADQPSFGARLQILMRSSAVVLLSDV